MNASPDIDLAFFIDKDNSPFVLFDATGTILYLNDAAEILLGYTDRRTLYELALTYAPQDFGSRTTVLDLHYQQLNFYAIQVAYADEESIGLRLYYRPRTHRTHPTEPQRMQLTNINTILEAAITLFSMEHPARLELLTDADLPEFRLDQHTFSQLLRKSLHLFRASSRLRISLRLAIGESMIIEQRRHPVIRLSIEANGRYSEDDDAIKQLADSANILPTLTENSLVFDIPYIRA
jgi:nitrogen-specific signal transduction histidine kinase